MKIIKESINNDIQLLDDFMQNHYYGLPKVPLKDCDINDLRQMRDLARKLLRRAEKIEDPYKQLYSKYFDALSFAIKQNKPNYDLTNQIERDIWKTINGKEVDFSALNALASKYKDNKSLYYSIRKRILDKERWYD